jgi:hypothetical protein
MSYTEEPDILHTKSGYLLSNSMFVLGTSLGLLFPVMSPFFKTGVISIVYIPIASILVIYLNKIILNESYGLFFSSLRHYTSGVKITEDKISLITLDILGKIDEKTFTMNKENVEDIDRINTLFGRDALIIYSKEDKMLVRTSHPELIKFEVINDRL